MTTKDEAAFAPKGPFSERELFLLREVSAVLEEIGVSAWLDQGTLLGLVREERLLPWDHDLDLGAWQDEISRCEPELAARLARRLAGTATVAWGCRTIGINAIDSKKYLPVNIGLYQRDGDRAIKWFGRPPAGMPVHRRLVQGVVAKFVKPALVLPSSWLMGLAAGSRSNGASFPRLAAQKAARTILELRDRGRDSIAAPIKTSVSARFFDELQPVLLGDVKAVAPCDAEAYLEVKYGPDWRTPRRSWHYWEQDGAIVHG